MDVLGFDSRTVRSVVQKLLLLVKSETSGVHSFYYMKNNEDSPVVMVATNFKNAAVMHYIYNLVCDFNTNFCDVKQKFQNASVASQDSSIITKNIYQQISNSTVVSKEDRTNRIYTIKSVSTGPGVDFMLNSSDLGNMELISTKTLTDYARNFFKDVCMDC